MAATDGKKTAATQNIANLNQYGSNLTGAAYQEYYDELMGRITDRTQLDQYQSYVEQELLNRGMQIDQFDKAFEAYESGNEYVDRAAQTAVEQEYLAYQQRLMGHESDFANMQRQNQRAQLEAGYATKGLNFQLNNAGIDIQNQQLANSNQSLTNQNLRLDVANQRLSNQNILNQISNQQLDYSNLDLQIANNSLQQKQISNNMASVQRDANMIRNSIASNVIDAQELDRQSQRLRIEDQNRQQQFGVQMQEQALQIQKQASDANLAMLQETLKGQAAVATSAASGKRGNSAAAMMKAASTLSSINQGAISDGLRRGNLSFKNAVTGLVSQEQAGKALNEISQQSIAGQKDQNLLARDSLGQQLAQNRLKMGNLRLDSQTVANNTSMLENNQEAVLNNINSSVNNLQQGQNNLAQKQNNVRQGENQLQQGKNQVEKLKNNQASIQNSIDEVATMLGLTQEQFEADAETLNQMMLDELPAFENVLDRISNSAYKDKNNLYNKMPLPPQFASLAEPPYDIADPEKMDPTLVEPVFHDSDAYAVQQPSGGGGGLGGSIGALVGTIAGIALAPTGAGIPILAASAGLGGSIGGGLGNIVDAFSY